MNTQENNKMIAEFMNHSHPLLPSKSTINYLAEDLEYDNDWNWLMHVVEKIYKIAVDDENVERYYEISDNLPHIHATYNAVVEFINKHKNK